MQSQNILFRCKLILVIIFLVILVCLQLPAYSGGLFYGFQLPELGLANSPLFCHNSGFFTYTLSPGFQRMGWFFYGMISSIEPAENVYGSIAGGILLGQEIKLGPFFAAANILAGLGMSASDLGNYPGHLELMGEVQAELGFYLSDWMQIGLYLSLQGFGNLLPSIPFRKYAFYSPVAGLKLIWHSED